MGDPRGLEDSRHRNLQLHKQDITRPESLLRCLDVGISEIQIGSGCHDDTVLRVIIDCDQGNARRLVRAYDSADIYAFSLVVFDGIVSENIVSNLTDKRDISTDSLGGCLKSVFFSFSLLNNYSLVTNPVLKR